MNKGYTNLGEEEKRVRMEQEDELRRVKARHQLLGHLSVLLAVLLMVLLAAAIVSIKVTVTRKEEQKKTFEPLKQQVSYFNI